MATGRDTDELSASLPLQGEAVLALSSLRRSSVENVGVTTYSSPLEHARCLDAIAEALSDSPSGTFAAVFMLDCERLCSKTCPPREVEDITALVEAAGRLCTSGPTRHLALRLSYSRILVIAYGLVDGAGVLWTATRLVQAYETVLEIADMEAFDDVSIGIASTAQHRNCPEKLLAGAEAALGSALLANQVARNMSIEHR